jgi:hypothetical protein
MWWKLQRERCILAAAKKDCGTPPYKSINILNMA